MKSRINSLTEVRSPYPSTSENTIRRLTGRLSEGRSKVIENVEAFMLEGGIEQPVERVLEVFCDYLRVCGHLESLATEYEREGSEKSKKSAETIREEYLPLYSYVGDQFYAIKCLLSFVVRVGELESEVDHYEDTLNAINGITK